MSKKTVLAKKFVDLIETGQKRIEIQDLIVKDPVILNNDLSSKNIWIINCTLEAGFIVQNISLPGELIFKDCEIDSVLFDNVNSLHSSEDGIPGPLNLSFANCICVNEIKVERSKKLSHQIIIEDSKINRLTISNLKLEKIIKIADSTFTQGIAISNCSSEHNFFLTDCEFLPKQTISANVSDDNIEPLSIEDSQFNGIFIHKNKGDFDIHQVVVNSSQIEIIGNSCHDILLESTMVKKKLILFNNFCNEFNLKLFREDEERRRKRIDLEKIDYSDYQIHECHISNNVIKSKFAIGGLVHERRLKMSGKPDSQTPGSYLNDSPEFRSKFKKVDIKFTPITIGSYTFVNLDFDEIEISGIQKEGFLDFLFCRFNRINFIVYENQGNCNLTSCSPFELNGRSTLFSVAISKLGAFTLRNVDLSRFKSVALDRVILKGLKFINVKWFNDSQLSFYKDEQFPNQARTNIYTQLRTCSEDQGDSVSALWFRKQELNALRNTKDLRFGDRVILLLGKLNDHGLNWWRPFWLTGILSLLFHFVLCRIIFEQTPFPWPMPFHCWFNRLLSNSIEVWWNNIATWPQLLNPTHSLKKVFEGVELGFWAHAVDFLLKIFLAIMILQIVSAFRKFVKK